MYAFGMINTLFFYCCIICLASYKQPSYIDEKNVDIISVQKLCLLNRNDLMFKNIFLAQICWSIRSVKWHKEQVLCNVNKTFLLTEWRKMLLFRLKDCSIWFSSLSRKFKPLTRHAIWVNIFFHLKVWMVDVV